MDSYREDIYELMRHDDYKCKIDIIEIDALHKK